VPPIRGAQFASVSGHSRCCSERQVAFPHHFTTTLEGFRLARLHELVYEREARAAAGALNRMPFT
jgi:hypothetical protein